MAFDKIFELNSEYRRSVNSLCKFADIISYIKNNKNKRILIDLTEYKYINPSYAVIIAAIPYIAETMGNKSVIRYCTNDTKCNNFLKDTGILKHYGDTNTKGVSDLKGPVDFLIVRDLNESESIANQIIDNSPVQFDDLVKAELISKIYEVFANAFTHSTVDMVFCCGSFNHEKSLIFSIYDIGIGIPQSVNEYLAEPFDEANALKWAWQQGNSTLNGKLDYPRGAGFQTLEDFAIENNGEIFVGSSSAFCQISRKTKKFGFLAKPILGTFFSMQIKNDYVHKYSKNNNTIVTLNL